MNIKEIMKETCWGSLSYCCSLEKACIQRDRVMLALTMTHEEYNKLKNMFNDTVINNRRKNERNK